MTLWEVSNCPEPGRRKFCPSKDGADLELQRACMPSQCEVIRVYVPDNRVPMCEFLNGLIAGETIEVETGDGEA